MRLSSVDRAVADDILSHSLDLGRLDRSLVKRVLSLLRKAETEIVLRLSGKNLGAVSRASAEAMLAEIRAVLADYYARASSELSASMADIYDIQANVVQTSMVRVGINTGLSTTGVVAAAASDSVLIQGAVMREWWSRQAENTVFRVATAVRSGIIQGRANGEIIKGARAALEVPRRQAAALVQTATQTVANAARFRVFKANADIVKGVQQLSTLDSHTSDVCVAYSGATWDLDGNPIGDTTLPFNGGPPRHWNCRSVLVPLTRSFKELGINVPEPPVSTRASTDGQVSGKTSFNDFLTRKGEAFQNEVLGKGRADLWREGKITLSQLLDGGGKPLSISDLRKKYAA